MRDVLISFGTILILLGAILVIIGIFGRVISRLESLPPIIYFQKTIDGVSIGTSPILILALIIVYLILWFVKKI